MISLAGRVELAVRTNVVNWQAVTDILATLSTCAVLFPHYGQAQLTPSSATICFRAANPERGLLARFVLLSILSIALLGAKAILVVFHVKVPGLNQKLRVAEITDTLDWLNPLGIVATLRLPRDKRRSVACMRFAIRIQSLGIGHAEAVRGAITSFASPDLVRARFEGLMARLAYTVNLSSHNTPPGFPYYRTDMRLRQIVGSGTSAVVAAKLGRRFYGYDVSPVYVESARRRVAAQQEVAA